MTCRAGAGVTTTRSGAQTQAASAQDGAGAQVRAVQHGSALVYRKNSGRGSVMPRLCVYLSESELPNPPSKYKHKDGPRSVIFSLGRVAGDAGHQ